MPRKKGQKVELNNIDSLTGLMQETYNDACLQITSAQNTINELANGPTVQDIDDITKVSKEKAGLLKVKDSAIRIKLELAKLQSEIIKNNGDVKEAIKQETGGTASLNDFSSIRELIKKNASGHNIEDEE